MLAKDDTDPRRDGGGGGGGEAHSQDGAEACGAEPFMDGPCPSPSHGGRRRGNQNAGTLLFNLGAFMLPALYGAFVKLWVASIDPLS